MVSRGGPRTLGQFLKFAAENVVHTDPACNLFSDIEAARSPRVQVHLLQDQKIGILGVEKVDNLGQPQTALDVPIDHTNRRNWPKLQSAYRKVAGQNVYHLLAEWHRFADHGKFLRTGSRDAETSDVLGA